MRCMEAAGWMVSLMSPHCWPLRVWKLHFSGAHFHPTTFPQPRLVVTAVSPHTWGVEAHGAPFSPFFFSPAGPSKDAPFHLTFIKVTTFKKCSVSFRIKSDLKIKKTLGVLYTLDHSHTGRGMAKVQNDHPEWQTCVLWGDGGTWGGNMLPILYPRAWKWPSPVTIPWTTPPPFLFPIIKKKKEEWLPHIACVFPCGKHKKRKKEKNRPRHLFLTRAYKKKQLPHSPSRALYTHTLQSLIYQWHFCLSQNTFVIAICK